MVVMVVSKFLILTLFKLICTTSPSAPYFGIEIQSPTRTESLAETCILATKPRIVSLIPNIKMAAAAPKDTRNEQGKLLVRYATYMIPTYTVTKLLMTCIY